MDHEQGYIESGIIDDRTAREISAEVWTAVWHILDDCGDISVKTASRIAQIASDATECALADRNFQHRKREVSR